MKCENCGKEEVNFHFTSNINGTITEKNLCAECAAKLGYTDRLMQRPEASFEDIFMDLFGARPPRRMFSGYGLMFPTLIIPAMGVYMPGTGVDEESEEESEPEEAQPAAVPAGFKAEIDAEMQKRREINILREQMHQAAYAEDYEKAAALRDSIKKLENGVNS